MNDYATDRFPTKDEFLKDKEISGFMRSTRDECLNDSLLDEIEDWISGARLNRNKYAKNSRDSFNLSRSESHSLFHQYEHNKP